jgi:hypothetical protein
MYAPVLNPLTASIAPKGLVGTTLGTFTALQTVFSAVGPLVAGVLLGVGLSGAFLGLHLLISVTAVYGAWRLRGALAASRRAAAAVDTDPPRANGHARLEGDPAAYHAVV